MERPRIPIGVKDFRTLVRGRYLFADRTMLIGDILDKGTRDILFTRPRRFGKTLVISMLDRFLNIRYRDEESADDTFQNLEVSHHPLYQRWVEDGTKNGHPVIWLDMSLPDPLGSPSLQTWMGCYLGHLIRQDFGYLRDSDILSDDLKTRLFPRNDGPSADVLFRDLCHALKVHHGRAPVVLVDEFDSPVDPYLTDGPSGHITDYGRFLASALRGNDDISMTILTGARNLAADGLPVLPDAVHIDVTDPRFSRYFGITPDEMRGFIGRCVAYRYPDICDGGRRELVEERFGTASGWFGGYTIGGRAMFNPWCAMNFLKENVLLDNPVRPYWSDSAECGVLAPFMSHADPHTLSELADAHLSGEAIAVGHIDGTGPIRMKDGAFPRDGLLSLLLYAGYLTSDHLDGQYLLRIPNRDVGRSFDHVLFRHSSKNPSVPR